MVSIETYADRHFAGVDALWRQSFPDDALRNTAAVAIPDKLTVQPELFLVAVDSGQVTDRVIGSVMAGYDGHRGWISRIAVLRSRRHEGIARALIAEAERLLVSLGCRKVNLQVVTSNAEVLGFYQRIGYAVEERISMSKLLSS